MKKVILIAEDEKKISELIAKYLTLEGHEPHQVATGSQALLAFKSLQPDLVILDLMLPELDGMAVCKKIRSHSNTPIIMLTARVDEIDRLLGFSEGADDYVCKPFIPKELMARVKAILRRVNTPTSSDTLTYGPLHLLLSEHCLKINGQDVSLTQIEFNILHTFMANPNKAFTREDLLISGRGKYSDTYERTIDFHIKNLRRKINITSNEKFIKAIYGIGYKFIT